MKKRVALILVLLMLSSTGFAQNPRDSGGSTGGVSRHTSIVELGGLRRSIAPESQHLGRAVNRGRSGASASARRGHPVLTGAAIGAGAAYLINATACKTGESVCSAPGNLLMAGIGAGIGALVGVLVSRR